MDEDREYLGNVAYEAYTKAVGGTTFDGRPLPTFSELGERQQEGWIAAGWATVERVALDMSGEGQ